MKDDEPPLSPWELLLAGEGRSLDEALVLHYVAALFHNRKNETAEFEARLRKRFNFLATLLCASEQELEGLQGPGGPMLPMLRVLKESALRYNKARLPAEDVLADEQRLLDYLVTRLARENVEQFRILFLDRKNGLILDEVQTRGTVDHTPVYPREVAHRAVQLGAVSLVLVHNHPSGDPTPSEADVKITQQIQAALVVVGVKVADHIIIGNCRHTSFRKSGLLF